MNCCAEKEHIPAILPLRPGKLLPGPGGLFAMALLFRAGTARAEGTALPSSGETLCTLFSFSPETMGLLLFFGGCCLLLLRGQFWKYRFEKTSGNAPYGILMGEFAPRDRILFINRKFSEITGYSSKDIPSAEVWFALAYPEEKRRQRLWIEWEKHLAQNKGEAATTTVEVRCRDGSLKFLEFKAARHDRKGYIIYCSDVTEMHRIARENTKHQELLLQAQRIARMGTMTLSAATGELSWSRETFQLFGYTPESLVPSTSIYLSHVPPEDRGKIRPFFEERSCGGSVFSAEHRIFRKDGSKRWFYLRGKYTTSGVAALPRATCILMDITERKEAEQALLESEQKFRRMFESLQIGMLLVDPLEKLVVDANPKAYALLRQEETPLVGTPCFHLPFCTTRHAKNAPCSTCTYLTTLREQPHVTKEMPVQLQEGSQAVFMVTWAVLHLPEKEYILISLLDITEQKQIQQRLQESQDRFDLALRSANVGLWDFDMEKKRIIVNDVFLSMLEMPESPKELGLNQVIDIMHPEDRNIMWQNFNEHVEGRAPFYTAEFRLRLPGGKYKWILAAGQGVQYTPEGKVIRALGVHIDMDKRKQLEKDLQENLFRLNAAIEGARCGLWDWNLETGEIHVNALWASMLGYGLQDLGDGSGKITIKDFWNLSHPEDRADIEEALRKNSSGELANYRQEFRLRNVSGHWKWILSVGYICTRKNNGEPLRMVGIHVDMDDEKRLTQAMQEAKEAAEAATRAKSQFLANMSHEIRTPMNGVMGMTELLLETALDEEQRKFGEIIFSSAESLLIILNDILDFSKIEAGKMDISREPFDLQTLLEETLNVFVLQAQEKELDLILLLPEEVPSLLYGDPLRIRQILTNLLGNAVKFTPQGHITLRGRLIDEDAHTARIELAVEDTGIGIPPAQQETIFSSFSQGDASANRRYGGTGLGLTISRRLAELMEGALELESEENRGTTVRCSLALEKQESQNTPPQISQKLREAHVLILDSCREKQEQFELWLGEWGIPRKKAASWSEVPQLLEEARSQGTPFSMLIANASLEGPEEALLEDEVFRKNMASLRLFAEIPMGSLERTHRISEIISGFPNVELLQKPLQKFDVLEALNKIPSRKKNDGENPDSGLGGGTALHMVVCTAKMSDQILLRKILQDMGHRVSLCLHKKELLPMLLETRAGVLFMDCSSFEEMPDLSSALPELRLFGLMEKQEHSEKAKKALCEEAGARDILTFPLLPEKIESALKNL